MNQDWQGALVRQLLVLLVVCLLIGLITGEYAWALVVGLTGYLGWTLHQMRRLQQWLKRSEHDEPPPDGHGLWGDIFDNLYQMQRRDQRLRSQLQSVIDRVQGSTTALRDAVIMLDSEGNLEWWNPAAERLLGLKRPQDAGHPVSNLVRHPSFKEYFDSGRHNEPLELASPVSDRLWLQITITRYGNSEHLMVVRDITRLHLLEQMRKDFVANVSHELRTPLTVIAGYLETMLEHTDEMPSRWPRALNQMNQQAGRMQHLLNDLLLLAKLEATNPPNNSQPVNIAALLQSIKSDAQALSADQSHDIHLEADPLLLLKGSESELRSAFSNLIFNAVKYTPSEGEIRIRWWCNEYGAHLAVQDSGIGIEAKHLPRLTERFYRVDSSRASNTGGTGLGLAIVKHVLLRHQGRLDVDSTPGKGSVFTCHFPLTQITVR